MLSPSKFLWQLGASIETSKVETTLYEEEVNQAFEDFEKEEEFVFPPTEEKLLKFLVKKQKVEKEVMLCPRYSAIFDKFTTKSFDASDIQKNIIRRFKK